MRILIATVFATIGGAIGWWLGDYVGLMTAMVVSAFGGAIGWYFGAKFYREHLE